MASGSPRTWFKNVDFPTFERPTMAMVPKRMGRLGPMGQSSSRSDPMAAKARSRRAHLPPFLSGCNDKRHRLRGDQAAMSEENAGASGASAPGGQEKSQQFAPQGPTRGTASGLLVWLALLLSVLSLCAPLAHSGIWDPPEREVAELGRRIA